MLKGNNPKKIKLALFSTLIEKEHFIVYIFLKKRRWLWSSFVFNELENFKSWQNNNLNW